MNTVKFWSREKLTQFWHKNWYMGLHARMPHKCLVKKLFSYFLSLIFRNVGTFKERSFSNEIIYFILPKWRTKPNENLANNFHPFFLLQNWNFSSNWVVLPVVSIWRSTLYVESRGVTRFSAGCSFLKRIIILIHKYLGVHIFSNIILLSAYYSQCSLFGGSFFPKVHYSENDI